MAKDYRLFFLAICVWVTTILSIILFKNNVFEIASLSLFVLVFLLLSSVSIFIVIIVFRKKKHSWAGEGINKETAKKIATIGLAIVFVLFSFVNTSFHIQEETISADTIARDIKDLKTISVVGKVISTPSKSKSRFENSTTCSANIEAENITIGKVTFPSKIFIKYSGDETVCNLDFHSTVQINGKPSIDTQLEKQSLQISGDSAKQIKGTDDIYRLTNGIRKKFLDVLENSDFTTPEAKGLMAGMSIGDKTLMPDQLKSSFQVCSLSHLLAISGTHFAIIISLIMGLFFRLPRFLLTITKFLLIAGFVVLVHPEDSVSRAAVMSIIAGCAFFTKRKSTGITALAATIIILLMFDPFKAISFGFILSCSTTASIIIFSEKIQQRLESIFGGFFSEVLAIPICAWLTSMPIILVMNSSINLYGVLANVLVAPAIIFTIPLSFFLCIASSFSVFSAGVFHNILDLFIRLDSILCNYLAKIAYFINDLPYSKIDVVNPALCVFLALGFLILLCNFSKIYNTIFKKLMGYSASQYNNISQKIMRSRKKHYENIKQSFIKAPLKFVVIALLFILPIGATGLFIYQNSDERKIANDWVVATCNVGQADASLVRVSTNSAIMIDVAEDPQQSRDCLNRYNIQEINLLILTHFHSDHVGGLDGVLDTKIDKAYVSTVKPNTKETRQTLKKLREKHIKFSSPKPNTTDKIESDSREIKYTVLTNNFMKNKNEKNIDEVSKSNQSKTVNNSSISTVIESKSKDGDSGKSFVSVFLGDLEIDGQALAYKVLQKLSYTHFDYLKVAHHGSKSQFEKLCEYLSPKIVVYSAGKNNSFGHPNKNTVELFNRLGAKSYKTENGDVGLRIVENKLVVFS